MRKRTLGQNVESLQSRDRWRTYIGNHEGSIAVEFAIILPVMLTIFFGVTAFAETLMANRRVVNLSRALADLTAQYATLSDTDISNIFSVAAPIMGGFGTTSVTTTISSVFFNSPSAANNPVTAYLGWSAINSGTTSWTCSPQLTLVTSGSANDANKVQSNLAIAGTSVIVANVSFAYTPWFATQFFANGTVTLKQTTYAPPRKVTNIPYTGSSYKSCPNNTFTG